MAVFTGLGLAASPSITFSADTNTGIYSPGADQVAISTNGTGRLTIDASGNVNIDSNTLYVDAVNNRVGLGTSSPGQALSVVAPSTAQAIGIWNRASDNTYAGIYFKTNDGATDQSTILNAKIGTNGAQLSFYTKPDGGSATERLTIDSSGRLGIGTTSPGSPLHVKANSTEGIRIESIDFTGIYGLLTSRRSSGTPLDIAAIHSVGSLAPEISFSRSTNGSTFTESARINSSGKLLVGTSSNSGGATIQAIGSVQASIALRFPANNKNGGTTKPIAIETISTDGGNNTATVYANNRYGSGKWVFLAGFDTSGNAINSTTSASSGATFVFCITDAATNFPTT